MSREKQVARAVRELNRVVKTGLVFGSVTSDMAPALIDRYDLLRGVKKLGTWWEWSELFFGNGFDLSMHRRDCTDALWAATLAANKGPGQWYADSDSLRYSFFDKVEDRTTHAPAIGAVRLVHNVRLANCFAELIPIA